MKKFYKLCAFLLLNLILFACGKEKEKVANNNPITIGQTFVVKAIEPTVGGTPWSLTTHGLSETVFYLNRNGELVSRYIEDVKRIDSLTWELKVKKNVKFSDGTEVNADAIVWALNTIMEKNPLSNATAGKVKFTKKGDDLIEAVMERETQNIKALLTEWTNIIFKETDKGFVFSGPYTIKNFESGIKLELTPNPHYENVEKRGEVIVKSFNDLATMKLAFESGELDMIFGITPEIAEELKTRNKIIEKIDAGYQYFGILNLKSNILSDKKIREAINIGLNRNDYLQALKGGRVANGLFAQYFEFSGDIKIENDIEKANQILEEAGWILNANGIREKEGKELVINLMTYNSRPDLKIIMQVMLSQLKKLGINSTVAIVDNIDAEAKKGEFDLILYAQHSAPTGDPAYFLNQFFRTNGSKNVMSYSSQDVDTLLDELGKLSFGEETIKISKKIQEKIYEDLPVLFLVDPEWNIGVSERLKNYRPYSGDYYIINSELYK